MLQQERKNNCIALIIGGLIMLVLFFSFPPLFFIFLILVFSKKVDFQNILGKFGCFGNINGQEQDKMFNKNSKIDFQSYMQKNLNGQETVESKIINAIKRFDKSNKNDKYTTGQKESGFDKHDRKSYKTNSAVFTKDLDKKDSATKGGKYKSIWDDYESVLDKFKK